MAKTFHSYNAPATYSFSFPSYQSSDVKVRVDGVLKTAGTHYNINNYTTNGGGTVVFIDNSGSGGTNHTPSSGVVRIYRDTNVSTSKATFTPGSSIKAADLTNNTTQLLYRAQEEQEDFDPTTPNLLQTYQIEDNAITDVKIADNAIENANVKSDAAIDGAKVNPNFGSQNISTTGNLDVDGTTSIGTLSLSSASIHTTASDLLLNSNGGTVRVQDNLYVQHATDIDGNLNVDGTTTLDGTTIDGALNVSSQATFNGNVDLGNATSDTITATGRFDSNIIPSTDNTRDLGSGSSQWRDLYIDGTAYIDNLNADTVNIDGGSIDGTTIGSSSPNTGAFSTLSASGNADFNGNLDVAGNLDVDGTTDLDTTNIVGTLTVSGDSVIDQITINGNTISTSSGNLLLDSNGGTVSVQDNFSVTGNTTLGNSSSSDDLFIYSGIKSNLTPGQDGTYDVGTTNKKWKNIYVDNIKGDSIVTVGTDSDSDSKVYSAARANDLFRTEAQVNAQVVSLVDAVGGFVPITNETSFPNANPDINNGAGTLVSVPLANNITSNGSGIINNDLSTQATTLAGTAVTITDAGANKTFTAGFAIIVETTSTLNTYKFHRYVPNADDVTAVAGKIDKVETVADNLLNVDNFADLYQIDDFVDDQGNASAPTTDGGGVDALSAGDLAYDSTANVLKVYTGSTNGWQAAASLNGTGGTISGDINFNDNVKLKFGSEFEIFNGTTGNYENQHVLRTVNTETLLFEVANGSAGVAFNHRVGTGLQQFESMMSLVPNGAVTLRYDGSAKLATQDTGIDVTGGVYATGTFTAGSNIKANTDTGYVSAGAHDDIKILHDNTANRIQSTTDFPTYIEIPTGQKLEINHAQLEVMARFNPNTSVELFYDGGTTPKLATTANGVTVTGSLVTTENVNVTGNINASSNVTISKGTNKTNSIEHLLTLAHTSSETTTTGFGTGIKFQAERNNGALQTIGDIDLEADVNLDSTISAAMVFKPSVAGVPTERMHISSAGTTTLKSGEHDGGLYVLAAGSGQSTKVQIQAKTSGGTEHTWNLAVPRSADRFGIDNGVNTYLTILDGGNVGIGTLSPTSNLHLDDDDGAVLQLQRTSSNATNRFQLSVDGTDGTIDSSNATIFRNDGDTRMTITSSGKIEIKGTRGGDLQPHDADTLQLYTKSTDHSTNRGSGITFYNHDGGGYEMGGTIQVAKVNGTANDTAAYMRFGTRPAGSSDNSVLERLRIHSHGQLELKVPDANDALKITPSGTNANAKVNFNTPGTGAAVIKVQGSETLSIGADGRITNTGIDTSYVTTYFASNFAKLDIRGTNIADSNHYILSYGEGHANDHQFHMVNTVGDIVFRTGNDPNLTINSSGDVAVADGQFSVSDAVDDTDFTDNNLPGATNGLYVANTQQANGVWSALTAMAYNDITNNQSASFIVKSVDGSTTTPEVYITQRSVNTQRTAIKITNGGSVELNYDGGDDPKLATTENGAKIKSGTANFEVFSTTDDADAKITIVGKTPTGGVGQAGKVEIVAESTATDNGASSMHLRTRKNDNTVTTAITIDKDQDVSLPINGQRLRIGASQELKLVHDGTDSIIDNSAGNLIYRSATHRLQALNAENMIVAGTGGEVELYYDDSKKLSTISTGVAIGTDDTASDYVVSGSNATASLVLDPTDNNTVTALAINDCGSAQHYGVLASASGAAGVFAIFVDSGGTGAGSITFGNSGTSFNESSDYRIKENVVDITDGLTRLKQLKPCRFNFKQDTSKTVDGFLAHEAQTVVPEAVTGTKDEVDDSGAPVIQGMDKSKLVPLLTAALQEAIAKIEVLETKVAALEAA